jgi:hypothetical protein
MNQNYETGLQAIQEARAGVKPTGVPFVLCLCAALLLLVFGKGLYIESSPVFILILSLLVPGAIQTTLSRRVAARIPCPRCNRPFGWTSHWPLSRRVFACQNCGLQMYNGKTKMSTIGTMEIISKEQYYKFDHTIKSKRKRCAPLLLRALCIVVPSLQKRRIHIAKVLCEFKENTANYHRRRHDSLLDFRSTSSARNCHDFTRVHVLGLHEPNRCCMELVLFSHRHYLCDYRSLWAFWRHNGISTNFAFDVFIVTNVLRWLNGNFILGCARELRSILVVNQLVAGAVSILGLTPKLSHS